MDNYKAIEMLEYAQTAYDPCSYGAVKIAIDKALEALQKQIPKKPHDLDSVPRNRCPSCYDAVRVYSHGMKLKYCPWCGQALNWDEID